MNACVSEDRFVELVQACSPVRCLRIRRRSRDENRASPSTVLATMQRHVSNPRLRRERDELDTDGHAVFAPPALSHVAANNLALYSRNSMLRSGVGLCVGVQIASPQLREISRA